MPFVDGNSYKSKNLYYQKFTTKCFNSQSFFFIHKAKTEKFNFEVEKMCAIESTFVGLSTLISMISYFSLVCICEKKTVSMFFFVMLFFSINKLYFESTLDVGYDKDWGES